MLIAKNLLTREASYKVFGTHGPRGSALKLMTLAAQAICGTKAASQSRNIECLKKQRRRSCVANTPKPM
jgi:hypothetical protein